MTTTRGRDRTTITANATRAAVLPGLQRPNGEAGRSRWEGDVTTTLEVWQGKRGPFDKLVSKRELHDELQTLGLISTQNAQNATTKGGVPIIGPNGVQTVVPYDVFAESIRATKLFRDLDRKIDDPARFDDMPARVREILLADLTPLRGQVDASVRRIEEVSKKADEAQAIFGTEIRAQVNQAAAGVRQVSAASANATRAVAIDVTTVTAGLADMGGEDPGTATVEQIMLAVADRWDGLRAQYTVKVATNGAMAGIGLAATTSVEGNSTSHVIIMADKFAVVGSGDTLSGSGTTSSPYTPPADRVPFGIDTGNNTIYLNGTVRINNSGPRIDSAVKRIELSANTDSFILDGRGNASPSSVSITCARHNGLTGTVTWSVTNGTATLTSTSNSGATLTFANLTTDTATIQASCTDTSVTYTHSITIKKALDGVRGSVTGTGLFYGISSSSWSANKANRVISNIINGESLTTDLVATTLNSIGDSVTLANGTSFSETRYWNGSAWTAPGTIINGDLLVDGTISADKLSVTNLAAIHADLGTVTAGSITGTAGIDITGQAKFAGSTTGGPGTTAVLANLAEGSQFGVVGYSGSVADSAGVIGLADGTGRYGVIGTTLTGGGFGVHGASGTGIGVQGFGTGAGGIGGSFAGNSSSEIALQISTGRFRIDSGKFSTSSGSGTATFSGKTPNGATNTNDWVEVFKDGTKGWVPWWPDA